MTSHEAADDPLAAYHREIFGIEDRWFEELDASLGWPRTDEPFKASPWRKDYWKGLRKIQKRHGIAWQTDRRAFSIAAYRHEYAAIEARRKPSNEEVEEVEELGEEDP